MIKPMTKIKPIKPMMRRRCRIMTSGRLWDKSQIEDEDEDDEDYPDYEDYTPSDLHGLSKAMWDL